MNLPKKENAPALKMTDARKAILQVLEESTDHPSVETIFERVKKIDPQIGMATVYRTVNLMHEMGMIVRHEFKENHARFELHDGEKHFHLIDIETGKIIEFYNDDLEQQYRKIATTLGYDMVDFSFEIYARKRKRPGA